MASSLAQELTSRLSHQLDLIAAACSGPEVSSSSPATPLEEEQPSDDVATTIAGIKEKQKNDAAAAVSSLQATLSRIRSSISSLSLHKLQLHVEEVAKVEQNMAVLAKDTLSTAASAASQLQLQWLLNAHLAVRCWGVTLQQLMKQAEQIKDEEAYWQSVEGEDATGLLYLVQTAPLRLANVLKILLERLHVIASSPRPPKSLVSLRVVKRALPPSLLLTSLFPHLSASSNATHVSAAGISAAHHSSHPPRSLLFLTFSPLLLTRQEVSQKRRRLKDMRYSLARAIGAYVKDAESARTALQSEAVEQIDDLFVLGSIAAQRLGFAQNILASLENPVTDNEDSEDYTAVSQAELPSDLLATVQLVNSSLTARTAAFDNSLSPLTRPAWLTRSWPWLVSVPVVGVYVAKKIYNSRESIYEYYELAKETARGFFVDWVIEPTIKILETLRHGDGSLAIMGRESLKSDFDSLERMVADFAKDQKLSPEQVAAVAAKVREGDMTVVLGAYEQDLKSPFKSAVTGSLIRTLLIQIQKVKVDVDIAMDGIEKMLKSQQLTFAFVGVAPSMVLLYLLSRLLPSLSRSSPSRSSREVRKQVWYTLRAIDRILTASLDDNVADPQVLDDVSTGLLLIELTTLRDFVASSAFPIRDRGIKAAFLEDVRDLESGSKGLEAKLRVFDRIRRGYEDFLNV